MYEVGYIYQIIIVKIISNNILQRTLRKTIAVFKTKGGGVVINLSVSKIFVVCGLMLYEYISMKTMCLKVDRNVSL